MNKCAAPSRWYRSRPANGCVQRHEETWRANAALRKDFGADPIYVTVDGDLGRTLALRNLVPLTGLEGKLARLAGVKAVYGPGTFINQTVVQTDRVIGAAQPSKAPLEFRQARPAHYPAAAHHRRGGFRFGLTKAGAAERDGLVHPRTSAGRRQLRISSSRSAAGWGWVPRNQSI